MASTLTTFQNLLKKRYDSRRVADLVECHSPFMAMIPKNENFMGESQEIPLIHALPQGLAAVSLAQAQTSSSNLKSKKFSLTTGTYIGSVSFGDKVMKATRGQEGAFLQNRTAETDGLHKQIGMQLSTFLYGNGGGAIGQIHSGYSSGNTFELQNPSDIINFEEGMRLVFSGDGDGSTATDAVRAGSTYVTAVDRANATVTVEDFGDVTGEAAGDFVFRQGDFVGDTSGIELFHGLRSFCWHNATPGVLYGMTRTSDPIRLAGSRVDTDDTDGLNMEDKILKLGSVMTGRYGVSKLTHAFANPEDWGELQSALRSQGYHPSKDTSTRFGFTKIETVLGGQMVNIYADPYCPRGTFFALNMDYWKMHSMGKLVRPVDEDGLQILRAATTLDYELRLVSYSAPCTNAPVYTGRVDLGTA